MEPLRITPELVRSLSYLPSADRQVLHRNHGRYVGAELTERGWVVEPSQLADSPAQWRQRYGGTTPR